MGAAPTRCIASPQGRVAARSRPRWVSPQPGPPASRIPARHVPVVAPLGTLQTMFAGQPLSVAQTGVDPFAHVAAHVVAAVAFPPPPPPPPPARQHKLPPVQLASVAHCWMVPPAQAAAFATHVCCVAPIARAVQHSIGGTHEFVPHGIGAAPVVAPLLLLLVGPGQTAVLHG
jgi:hypothetical protein